MTTSPISTTDLKERALARCEAIADRMLQLSHQLHAEPELAFQEHTSAGRVAAIMQEAGFDTRVGVYGLDTAVEATYGTGTFRVVLCTEYDALPELGHACGHNMIAAISTGVAVALTEVADKLGITVVLLGTPAEEGGAGKILLLEAGAFDTATIAAMVHPFGGTDVPCATFGSQAIDRFLVTYEGKASHSAAYPTHAVNAHTAATVAHVALGMIRQQLEDEVRVHAYTVHGGDASNIIPARTVIEAEVRSYRMDNLANATKRVMDCFEAGAVASGCTMRVERSLPRHDTLAQDPMLGTLWDANLIATGRELSEPEAPIGGSTDMGNVTQYMPAIHPGVCILGSPHVNHTVGFAEDTVGASGDRAVIDALTALTGTIVDAAGTASVREDLLQRAAHRAPYSAT